MKATEPEQSEEAKGTSLARLGLLVGAVLLLGVWGSFSAVVIVFALVLTIFLHELGHFLTAKAAGMKVTEFFIGFGPRIWSFHRGETEYGVKAIPAGAYVRIIGMSNLDEVDPADEERTYRCKPYWRRLSVAVAGSAMHMLIALVLIYAVFVGFGRIDPNSDRWSVGTVGQGSPAAEAGLQPGDRILAVDGQRFDDFDELSSYLRDQPGERVEITVDRGGRQQALTARLAERHPVTTEDVGYLGVSPTFDRIRSGPIEGLADSVSETVHVAGQSVLGIGKLFSPSGISGYVETLTDSDGTPPGVVSETRPTSVVGIVQVGSQAAQEGFVNVLYLLFAVNVFIGVFNMTPLLPFDGGHVVIATYEKVRSMISGRRYHADVTKLLPLTYAVVAVLALLFVTTIYIDIADPISIR